MQTQYSCGQGRRAKCLGRPQGFLRGFTAKVAAELVLKNKGLSPGRQHKGGEALQAEEQQVLGHRGTEQPAVLEELPAVQSVVGEQAR